MKIQINPYIKTIFKNNLSYFIITVPLIIASIFIPSYLVKKYFSNNEKVTRLNQELVELRVKQNILSSAEDENPLALDEDVEVINKLIPNFEDYFSVIYTLEQLSAKTNFLITDYEIDLKKSSGEKLALSITGLGDESAFLNFLREYNFGGGRLVTADKINFSETKSNQIKLDIAFYSKKPDQGLTQDINYKYSLERIKQIKSKIGFSLQEASVEADLSNYPTKSNPF